MTRSPDLAAVPLRNGFRRSLPASALAPLPPAGRDDDQDLKLFVLSFTAFFICFFTMLL